MTGRGPRPTKTKVTSIPSIGAETGRLRLLRPAETFSTILAAEGKPPPGGLHFTTERMPGVFMTVPDWPAYAKAVDQSRIDAGVHFRFTAEASDPMGIRLGQMAMERLKPLP